jgi:hypothetical protein
MGAFAPCVSRRCNYARHSVATDWHIVTVMAHFQDSLQRARRRLVWSSYWRVHATAAARSCNETSGVDLEEEASHLGVEGVWRFDVRVVTYPG